MDFWENPSPVDAGISERWQGQRKQAKRVLSAMALILHNIHYAYVKVDGS